MPVNGRTPATEDQTLDPTIGMTEAFAERSIHQNSIEHDILCGLTSH